MYLNKLKINISYSHKNRLIKVHYTQYNALYVYVVQLWHYFFSCCFFFNVQALMLWRTFGVLLCCTRPPGCLWAGDSSSLLQRPSFKNAFAMDTDETPCPVAAAAAGSRDEEVPFREVKRPAKSHKRKREQRADTMDTEDSVDNKRPHFPPISRDKLQVKSLCDLLRIVRLSGLIRTSRGN